MKTKLQKLTVWFSSRKLKQKVRSLFIIIMGAYFLLFLFIYIFVIRSNTEEYITDTNYNMLSSVNNSLERELTGASTVSKWIMNSQEVRDYLKGNGDAKSSSAYSALASMYEFTTSELHISSVYIFKPSGDYIDIANGVTSVDRSIIMDRSWRREIEEKAGAYTIRVNGGGAFRTASGQPVISLIRVINDQQTQKPIGMLVMNYSTGLLEDTYQELSGGERKFGYFDLDGNVICGDELLVKNYSPITINTKESFWLQKSDGNRILYYHRLTNTPFTVVAYEDVNFYSYVSTETILMIAVFVIMTALSLVLIGLFMSFYITRPVERLVQSMDDVKSGWFKRVSLKLPNDEIGHLKDSYNNMLVEINRLIEELVVKETAIQQAEIEVLQEQIKPHFLYNTLDTIAYLALDKPSEEVYDAIETLGNFYRKFLSKGSRTIPLSDEIQIVENYLKLQKLRYADVFEDEYDVCPELMNIPVPKLILQPIVENSLYHGVRLKGEEGLIRVSVYELEDRLCISVYDTGVGMSRDEIEALMDTEGKSFGLRKTIERIQTYYGTSDVYEIKSKKGYDCEVILKLPVGQGGGH